MAPKRELVGRARSPRGGQRLPKVAEVLLRRRRSPTGMEVAATGPREAEAEVPSPNGEVSSTFSYFYSLLTVYNRLNSYMDSKGHDLLKFDP